MTRRCRTSIHMVFEAATTRARRRMRVAQGSTRSGANLEKAAVRPSAAALCPRELEPTAYLVRWLTNSWYRSFSSFTTLDNASAPSLVALDEQSSDQGATATPGSLQVQLRPHSFCSPRSPITGFNARHASAPRRDDTIRALSSAVERAEPSRRGESSLVPRRGERSCLEHSGWALCSGKRYTSSRHLCRHT